MHTHTTPEGQTNRVATLKQQTHAAHEQLDNRIMASDPFRDRANFARFVTVQYHFHRDIEPIYTSDAARALLPDLAQRRRLGLIEQDLHDLEITLPTSAFEPVKFAMPLDIPTALGWLYVAEGSNLGAAILSREAVKLGLSDSFGARHLAAHPEGRGQSWQRFVAALNALSLNEEEDKRVTEGAIAAFNRVQSLAETIFA